MSRNVALREAEGCEEQQEARGDIDKRGRGNRLSQSMNVGKKANDQWGGGTAA